MGFDRFRHARRIDATDIGIYHNDLTQLLKLKKAAGKTYLVGAANVTDDLHIAANTYDAYGAIVLYGGGEVGFKHASGSYARIYNAGTVYLTMSYASNVSMLEGGGVTGDAFKLKANTIDATPYLSLTGASDALIGLPAAHLLSIAVGGTGIAKIAPGGAGAGGVLQLRETTTPTASADFGALYTKADNHLYFQDGAGVEHDMGSP